MGSVPAMTAQHAPGAEHQATTDKERERARRDIAGGVDTITAAWVGRLLEDLASAEAALANEQAVGAGMAADVLRMSESLGKKIEEVTEAEAQAARLWPFVAHKLHCDVVKRGGGIACDCGLRAALEEAPDAQ